jgi:hypothetical protein
MKNVFNFIETFLEKTEKNSRPYIYNKIKLTKKLAN